MTNLQVVDAAFRGGKAGKAEKRGLAFFPNSRLADRAMMSAVPFLGKMSIQVFATASDRGIHFVVYYPKTRSFDGENVWPWEKIHFARWTYKRSFQLELDMEEKTVDLVSIGPDRARVEAFIRALEDRFDGQGHNRKMIYPDEEDTDRKKAEGGTEVPKNFLKMRARRERKQSFNRWRTKLGIVVAGLMLAYILLKGIFKII